MLRGPALTTLARLYPGVLWRVPEAGSRVFLTFDDGPCPAVTPWVLDTLAAYQAKATFFCTGTQAASHPALLQRIRAEGHTAGHHTWDHADGWRTTPRAWLRSMLLASTLIGGPLFRPPYGHLPPRMAALLGKRFQVVMWDVMAYDFTPGRSGSACARRVLRSARPGSIIVLHDNPKSAPCLRQALVPILEGLSSKGLACAALPSPATSR